MIKLTEPYFDEEESKAVAKVLKSGQIAQGPKVEEFEKKFSETCGVKHAVAVNSGTAALHTALHSVGITVDDEVITTPFTFIATANAILMCGAKPVFADVKEDTFNINPKQIEAAITKRTRAILTVDLYGQLCDYNEIMKIAKKHNLIVIEDACQAIGADFNSIKAGAFGDIAVFSFYATKNITAGEGGMITTNNDDYARVARAFRFHSRLANQYEHSDVGYNYRMTDIAAAIGIVQLSKLDEITNKRTANAEYLTEQLKNSVKVPVVKSGCRHAFHQYTIKVGTAIRDKLIEKLKQAGIEARVFYPKPVHLQHHFVKRGYKEGDFPIAEKLSNNTISLPIHPGLTKQDLDKVISSIQEHI